MTLHAPARPLDLALHVRRWRSEVGEWPPKSLRPPLGVEAWAPIGAALGATQTLDPMRDGDAVWFVPRGVAELETPWGLVQALPDPGDLGPAILVVAPVAPVAGFFARLLRPERTISRAARGSALLLKGYSGIGGGVDPESGVDLVWGRPGASG